MRNILIIFVLVLLSSYLSVAYEIDGITIETCNATGCINQRPNVKFALNCAVMEAPTCISHTSVISTLTVNIMVLPRSGDIQRRMKYTFVQIIPC